MNDSLDYVVKLVTYRGQKIEVIIDRTDEKLFDMHTWHGSSNGRSNISYITTNVYNSMTKQSRRLYLHRYLMAPPDDMVVDHKNRNTMDNRRSNLRVVTRAQNIANSKGSSTYCGRPASSVYKGVSWSKKRRKWKAQICYEGESIGLGYFPDEVPAAKTYDRKASELLGEYAYLNFPDELTFSNETVIGSEALELANAPVPFSTYESS